MGKYYINPKGTNLSASSKETGTFKQLAEVEKSVVKMLDELAEKLLAKEAKEKKRKRKV